MAYRVWGKEYQRVISGIWSRDEAKTEDLLVNYSHDRISTDCTLVGVMLVTLRMLKDLRKTYTDNNQFDSWHV
jgi:hypothetical protein